MSADYTLPAPRRPRPPASTLSGGEGGGTMDPMEARVARLENDMREIKADLKALRLDSAQIKGRISQLPSTKEMITLVIGVLGLAFLIVKFGMH
jgi:outer membrane murein-binding lipoprotein Lpp